MIALYWSTLFSIETDPWSLIRVDVPDLPGAEFVPAKLEPAAPAIAEDARPSAAVEIIHDGTTIRLEATASPDRIAGIVRALGRAA